MEVPSFTQPTSQPTRTHTYASPATVARANGVRTNPKTTKPARRGAKGTASAHAALCETAPPPEPSIAQTCTPKGRTAGAQTKTATQHNTTQHNSNKRGP